MELREIEVKTTRSLTLPMEEMQLMPIGDIQLGSEGVQVERLKKQIEWAKSQGNVYFIGMGDYVDVMSPSNRESWNRMKKYKPVADAMTDSAKRAVDDIVKLFRGTEGRWLGLLEGHHFYEFKDGTTSDTLIAQAMDTNFLGTCAIVRLKFPRKGKNQHYISADVWAHHGWGSGKYPHSTLNKLYDAANWFDGIDVFLMGHHTKKNAVKIPKIFMDNAGRMRERNIVLAGTGGFLSGYVEGAKSEAGNPRGLYVEQHGLGPAYLGSPLIKIRPVHGADYDRIDLNVEI